MPPLPLQRIEEEALRGGSLQGTLEFLQKFLKEDPRPAAQKLLARYEKKAASEQKEKNRMEVLGVYEREAASKGFKNIAGVDEAGRGPLAGPVVAAAVIFSPGDFLAGLDDSKKLTESKREELFPLIHEKALAVGVGSASTKEIDEINIYQAARLAMERAIEALSVKPDYLLTDAMPLPKFQVPQKPLIHGDSLSLSIAAASIVAKVTRDRGIKDLHEKYPQYGFASHKGYGTEEHLAALKAHGPCPEHRKTFGPVLSVSSLKSEGGAFGFWGKKLKGAASLKELTQVGVQIKRVAMGDLTEAQLGDLRELFKNRRARWEKK